MLEPPWTGLGALQQEVMDIKREINRKADSHEIYSLRNRVDSLEHSLREIGSKIDGLEYRLQEVEARVKEQGK